MAQTYHEALLKLLDELRAAEAAKIKSVALKAKVAVEAGGLLHVFGSGHSAILAEEAFHRAGGLAPVRPLFLAALTPQTAPRLAGRLERLEGVAAALFDQARAKAGDLMFIASNSGVNAAAIEMAQAARGAGLVTVAITSVTHSSATASRHSSGKKLMDLADFVIDNHCPPGDALVDIGGTAVGAGSTVANCWIWHSMAVEVCRLLQVEGKSLPVWVSANRPGGDRLNEALEKQYRDRVPLL